MVSLAFDFPDAETAVKFAEMAYNACNIINVDVQILHNEIDTTNSPMWRNSNIKLKQMLNSRYGYVDTDVDFK